VPYAGAGENSRPGLVRVEILDDAGRGRLYPDESGARCRVHRVELVPGQCGDFLAFLSGSQKERLDVFAWSTKITPAERRRETETGEPEDAI
jgi:hypothetical protein